MTTTPSKQGDPKAEAVEAVVQMAFRAGAMSLRGQQAQAVREAALRLWDAAQAAMPCAIWWGNTGDTDNIGCPVEFADGRIEYCASCQARKRSHR